MGGMAHALSKTRSTRDDMEFDCSIWSLTAAYRENGSCPVCKPGDADLSCGNMLLDCNMAKPCNQNGWQRAELEGNTHPTICAKPIARHKTPLLLRCMIDLDCSSRSSAAHTQLGDEYAVRNLGGTAVLVKSTRPEKRQFGQHDSQNAKITAAARHTQILLDMLGALIA